MLDLIKKGEALVFIGHENSGKTKAAIREAKKLGAYFIGNIENVLPPFCLGTILNNDIKSIIVDNCPIQLLNCPQIKSLISSSKLMIEKRGEDAKMVTNIQWIFTVCLSRRFSIINL